MTTTRQLTITDLQFQGADDTSQKLRRLVHDLAVAEQAINALLNSVATLAAASSSEGGTLFANPELQAAYNVTGLTPGAVLQALTATSAAFAKLNLAQLSNVAIEEPASGQVLTYQYGEWVNEDIPAAATGATGTNVGTGAGVYAGLMAGVLAFKSLSGDGSTIEIDTTSDTITISYIGPSLADAGVGPMGPPGLDGEPGEDGMMVPSGPGSSAVSSGFSYQQAAALVSMRM